MIPQPLSPGEEEFWNNCRAYGFTPVREFQFHPTRKWLLDFYFLERDFAVEIEGGTKRKSRHTQNRGFTEDCRKYNEAAAMGIRVLRFTTAMVFSGEAIDHVRAMLA